MCEHDRVRSFCRDCGGSQICEHDKRRSKCKLCGGGSICEHQKVKSACNICDPNGYLSGIIRSRVYAALQSEKTNHSIEYLGCTIEEFRDHIEQQFTQEMSWSNHGSLWHIDHIIPLKYGNPTIEQVIERLRYTNTQPMLASENIAKGNRFIGSA